MLAEPPYSGEPALKPSNLALRRILILCFLLPTLALAKPFTLEQVRAYAYPENLVSAEKSPRIAWSSDDAGHRNLWVADGEPLRARQVTSYTKDDGQDLTNLSLTADGARLVYVRGGEHGGNWDTGSPVNVLSDPAGTKVEVWVVDLAGPGSNAGAPRLIGEGDSPAVSPDGKRVVYLKGTEAWIASLEGEPQPKKLFTIRGVPQSLAWSPDGREIAFVSNRETHALIGIYSDESTPIRWIAPSTSRDDAPRWSPDGKKIAFVRRKGAGGEPQPMLDYEPLSWELWIADAATGKAQKRYASAPAVDTSDYGLYVEWAAGDRIVFNSYADGWPHLYSVGADGKALKLTPGDFQVEDAVLSRDRKFVVYNANTGKDPKDIERRHLFQVPVDAASPKALTSGAGLEWTPVALADARVAFFSATAQRPPVPASVSRGKIELVGGLAAKPEFPEKSLITPEPVTFKSADGLTIHGQLFKAPGSSGKRAAVVYLHGGPPRQMLLGWHYMGYYSNDYALNQYLASRGFVVLAVNYRLGIGYGREFQFPAKAGPRGASEYQDVQAGGHYLQSRADVDPKRVGVYGGSYGGYLTAMALSRNSDIFAVGVDIHGVHDWIGKGEYGLPLRPEHGSPPDLEEGLKVAWASSPASDISKWTSPVLFIHGDDDRNVSIAQTVDLVERLKKTDVHQEQLLLVDETHSIYRYSNELLMNAAAAEFLERYLKP